MKIWYFGEKNSGFVDLRLGGAFDEPDIKLYTA